LPAFSERPLPAACATACGLPLARISRLSDIAHQVHRFANACTNVLDALRRSQETMAHLL
jgi:hypothetical protein